MTLMQRMRTQGLLALLGLLLAPSAWADVVEYIHTDALGSPVAVTDQAAQVVERTTYEPYGNVIGRANNDRQGYTGHVMDSATGLTYMQQRYYDSTVGRFLSVDPVTVDVKVASNFNRYWYANNNPYRFSDPDGRRSVGEMIDSASEGCGAVSCAGWAATKAIWDVFGFEGLSQVADKGSSAGKGNMGMAVLEVATLGKGGTILKVGEHAAEGVAKLTVKGFTGHAVDQAINRGVKPGQILDAIKNPLKIGEVKVDSLGRSSQKIVGQNATLAINPDAGKIVTVYPTSSKTAEKLLREQAKEQAK